MANRATEEEVLEILPANTTLTESSSSGTGTILPFINSANVFVTDLLTDAYTDETLKEIEKWLAAHMASVVNERLIKKAGAGGAEVEYAGSWGQGLTSTQYGQMVLMLDTSNILRNLMIGRRAAWTYAVEGE